MPTNPWRKLRRTLSLPPVPDDLLQQAFQHGSYVREQGLEPLATNQRLEFLGDVVLDLVVAEALYLRHPRSSEGSLTRQKAAVVRAQALAEVAERMGLGEYLLLGRGEEESGGRAKPSLLAECLEALIGAVYLASGFEAARDFVLSHIVTSGEPSGDQADCKSRLQEMLQSRLRRPPEYVTVATTGPPHDLVFTVEVRFAATVLGRGAGGSKREAEQQAAAEALAHAEEWLAGLTGGG
jgi:ribonuclease-3